MQLQSVFEKSKIVWVSLTLLVVFLLTAAVFGLTYPSNYSPLLFLGVVIVAVVFVMLIIQPVLACYVALFLVMLPVGLLPLEIHSQLNRGSTVLAFGVWLLAVLMKRRRVYWTGTAIVMVAFLTWSLLTLLRAENFEWAKTLFQVYSLRFVLFIFLIPNVIRTKRSLDGILITLALNGWVLVAFSLYALVQDGYTPGSRFKLLGVNENDASMMIVITLLGVLWVATQLSKQKRFIKTIMAVLYLLSTIVFVFASGSRGSAISLIITLIAFLLWRETRSWSIVCIILLFWTLLFFPSLFTTTIERFLLQSRDSLSLLGGREVLWKAAWEMIWEHPFDGVGIGNAGLAIQPYLGIANEVDGVSAHNPILVIWGETGLIGILLYAGILISALISFVKQYVRFRINSIYQRYMPYFALVTCIFLGFIVSWVKGGGMESAHSYFLILALLLIPSGLETVPFKRDS
jgi:putative inorganic carbon (hco3(-)) transporter